MLYEPSAQKCSVCRDVILYCDCQRKTSTFVEITLQPKPTNLEALETSPPNDSLAFQASRRDWVSEMQQIPVIDVVAAVMSRGGRFLLCKKPEGSSLQGKWEFPGGKVAEGETKESALTREILEELGIGVTVGELLGQSDHIASSSVYRVHYFRAIPVSTAPLTLFEHDGATWATEEEISNLQLAPSDENFLNENRSKLFQ
jgi:mutator protein MutT